MFNKIKIPFISKNRIGFRLSQLDLLFLFLAATFTFFYNENKILPDYVNDLFHWFVLFLVINFFMFCNVFRVKTKLELMWIISAVINILIYLIYYQNMLIFSVTQSFVSLFIILLEIKSSSYHGIFAKKINNLKEKYE